MSLPSQKHQKILQTVKVRLKEYFLKSEGEELLHIEVTGTLEKAFSVIIFLSAKTSKKNYPFVLKKIMDHSLNKNITGKQNQASVEYEILEFLYSSFKKVENCSVPRPILILPEIQSFVMEFVEGTLLAQELRYARYWTNNKRFQKVQEYFFLAGRWLQYFHKITGIEKAGKEFFEDILFRCNDRLRLIEESNSPYCPKNLGKAVIGQLERYLLTINNEEVLIAGRHGDFGMWNILVGEEGIVVHDFMGYCKEPLAVDIFKMLAALEEDSLSLSFSKRRLGVLKGNFLEGLGDMPFIPKAILDICEIHQRVCNLCGRILSSPKGYHHQIEKYFAVKMNINWLMNEHNRPSLWTEKISIKSNG